MKPELVHDMAFFLALLFMVLLLAMLPTMQSIMYNTAAVNLLSQVLCLSRSIVSHLPSSPCKQRTRIRETPVFFFLQTLKSTKIWPELTF